jgi:hypothetical protein
MRASFISEELMPRSTPFLLVSCLAMNGMLTGASLDQSIKQLPARKRIGVTAFSNYSQAADLGPGVPFYAVLGIGAAATTIVGSLRFKGNPAAVAAGGFSILHSLVTALAAPTNFSQRRYHDESSLARVFNKFAYLQDLRASLQLLALLSSALALSLPTRSDGQH